MDIRKEFLIRVYVVFAMFVVLAMVLFGKVVKINVVEGERWKTKGDSLYLKFMPIEADRGNILASDGSFLATSLPFFDIRVDLKANGMTDELFSQNIDSLAWSLSKYVDPEISPAEYKALLISERQMGNRYLLIKRRANYSEMKQIGSFPLFREGANKGGFIAERRSIRDRPYGGLAARTVGLHRSNAQSVGLEAYFDKYLKGAEGSRLMKRITKGVYIPVEDLTAIEPTKGCDLRTTLDIHFQDIAQNALLRGLEKYNADKGVAIVMEVETGAVKAICNLGKSKSGNWRESYNYAVGTATEPGSTIKAASTLALLDASHLSAHSEVNLRGGKRRYYDRWMYDSHEHGITKSTLGYAFEHSSNVGISTLVSRQFGSRPEQFIQYLRDFGLGEKTGIEVVGEAQPYIKDAGDLSHGWSGVSLPWMSIGYELQLTPLQILQFYNAIANDGKMMKAQLAQSLHCEDGSVTSFKPKVVKKKIASERAIKEVKKMMENVVLNGTGKNVRCNNFTIAGKTGTAQTDYSKGRVHIGYQASFAGYFPADKPKYSCIVVIYNPDKSTGYYGSAVAGPVFKEIAEKIYATRAIKQEPINANSPEWDMASLPGKGGGFADDLEYVFKSIGIKYVNRTHGDWVVFQSDNDQMEFGKREMDRGLVPNVLGMGLRDAVYILENSGLKVKAEGVGRVRGQSLKPGTPVKGQSIELKLG